MPAPLQMASDPNMNTCPSCKKKAPKNYKNCPYCHAKMMPGAQEPGQMDPSTNPAPWDTAGGGYTVQ